MQVFSVKYQFLYSQSSFARAVYVSLVLSILIMVGVCVSGESSIESTCFLSLSFHSREGASTKKKDFVLKPLIFSLFHHRNGKNCFSSQLNPILNACVKLLTIDSLATRSDSSCRRDSRSSRSAAARCCSPCRHHLFGKEKTIDRFAQLIFIQVNFT